MRLDADQLRTGLSAAMRYMLAILLALVAGAVLISLSGHDPVEAYGVLFKGSLVGKVNILRSLRWATPAIIAGLAAAIAFRAGVFNIGLEGQLYWGALVAAVVGYGVHELSPFMHVSVALLLAGVAGMICALIPAVLYLYFGINEVVNTLMMNYIAVLLTSYITRVFLMDGKSVAPNEVASPDVLASAYLPRLVEQYNTTLALPIGIGLCLFCYWLFKQTVFGYNLELVGLNRRHANYGGIPSGAVMLTAFAASGFLAGFLGGTEVLGVHHRFIADFSSGLGFDGILVGLLAKNHPLGVILSGLFFGVLKNGAFAMERLTSVSRTHIIVIQALFILLFTADLRLWWERTRTALRQRTEGRAVR